MAEHVDQYMKESELLLQRILKEGMLIRRKAGDLLPAQHRLAWPSENFLPGRSPSDLPEDFTIADLLSRPNEPDQYLRLCFSSSSGGPASYYPDPKLRTGGVLPSSEHPEKDAFMKDVQAYSWPLFSLSELVSVIQLFIAFLQENKNHIVETGFPRDIFAPSSWFDTVLSTVYFTKIPVYVMNHVEAKSGQGTYTYLWPLQVGKSINSSGFLDSFHRVLGAGPGYWYTRNFTAYTLQAELVHCVPYGEAALIEGLSSTDAETLAGIRDKFVCATIDLLKELVSAAIRRDTSDIRKNCLAILTKCLSAEETDLCNRIEAHYCHRYGMEYFAANHWFVRGAHLWNLLMLIGHFEEELTVGRLCRTRSELSYLIQHTGDTSQFSLQEQYDSIIGKPEQQLIDSAYEAFHQLGATERRFWEDYRAWVPTAYGEFYAMIYDQRVRRKHYRNMCSYMKAQASLAANHFEHTGQLPQFDAGNNATKSKDASTGRLQEYKFEREGQRWLVVYDRKHISLNHSDGAVYIAYMLEHPNKNLHVRELYAIAHAQREVRSENPSDDMNDEELSKENLSLDRFRSPTDKKDDAELLATFRQGKDDLQRELAEAQRNGKSREADELQTRLDDLQREMSKEFGLDGNPRQPGDPNKLAYDRVSRAIKSVQKRIEKHHPELALHLRNSVHYDTYTYVYSPEPSIDWKF